MEVDICLKTHFSVNRRQIMKGVSHGVRATDAHHSSAPLFLLPTASSFSAGTSVCLCFSTQRAAAQSPATIWSIWCLKVQ